MKIFLDTADIDEIKTAARWGVLDGVTTNPTLFAKVGGSYDDILKQVCKITPGPVSAECVKDDVDGMLEEGRHYATLAPNIVVKVAMSENGLEAISRFAEEGIKTNCTLIFTANQGLLAAKAGASLISPFVGRLDDINQDGMIVIRELAEIFAIHEIDSEVLAASIRTPVHMTQAALAGANIATVPVQGPPADGPPPADRQGHRPVQGGLGEGPRGGRRQGLDDGAEQAPVGRSEAEARPRPARQEVRLAPVGDDRRVAGVARPGQDGLAQRPARTEAARLGQDRREPEEARVRWSDDPGVLGRHVDGAADGRADDDSVVLRDEGRVGRVVEPLLPLVRRLLERRRRQRGEDRRPALVLGKREIETAEDRDVALLRAADRDRRVVV